MSAALVVGCGVAGAVVGVFLPVDVVPSEDGRTVAAGPSPIPDAVLHETWGRAMLLATAGVWAGLAASFGAVWQLPADLLVGAGLVALTVVDLRFQLLPRRIVIPLGLGALALFGLAAAATGSGDVFARSVLCAVAAFVVFAILRFANPAALGGGDVTLAAVLGLVLGWQSVDAVLAGLGVGIVLAAVFAVVGLAARRLRRDTALSYGPFLALGTLIVLFAAPSGHLFG
ncbi:MAG TPA: A24 family peptidase [Acidimicrobiia bacterium]|nr:A24 family peptidase [Acidimicrobiia bacterium]